MHSRITSKGQATIPKESRDHMNVRAGHELRFFNLPGGRVMILPVRPLTDLKGILKGHPRLELEEIDQAAAQGAVARDKRSRARK
jgi:AbrB family looped-hinge helix DNA binding protein